MLTRWSDLEFGDLDRGFAALNELRREIERIFDPSDKDQTSGGMVRPLRSRWPRISLYDNGTDLELRAEVPGFTDKDLNITIEQSSLTIRGERKEEAPKGYSVHRQERGGLQFARSFTLPTLIDTEKVEATLKNGILALKLPKAAEAQPRQIRVQSN